MNTKTYIESGILENYVLGLVSDSERKDVEAKASQYQEIQAELTAIEDALAIYSKQNAVPMPGGLSDKILNNIDRLENLEGNAKIIQASGRLMKGITALLGLVASILIFACVYLLNQNNNLKSQLSESDLILDTLQTKCDDIQNRLTKLEDYLDITHDQNFVPIIMKGEGLNKAPQAIASVFYNQSEQKAYLEIENLPQPPPDKQYQLWAIVDGQPQNMNVFDVILGPEGFIEVPFYPNAQAFAVTLEPKGGKATPTLTEMYVIGNVS